MLQKSYLISFIFGLVSFKNMLVVEENVSKDKKIIVRSMQKLKTHIKKVEKEQRSNKLFIQINSVILYNQLNHNKKGNWIQSIWLNLVPRPNIRNLVITNIETKKEGSELYISIIFKKYQVEVPPFVHVNKAKFVPLYIFKNDIIHLVYHFN